MAAWEDHARCRTVGVEPFFPTGRGADVTADMNAAKAVCHHCPVKKQCLDHALHLEGGRPAIERAGIWGGTTPRQRARIAKRRRHQHAA